MEQRTDVVVVGAGPVGLLTAIESSTGGARVVVLERLAAPSTVSKALGMGSLGAEALQRRGMGTALAEAEARGLAALQAVAARIGPARESNAGGHFGGLSLIRKDVQREPGRHARLVDQHQVERMLADRASALGIEVRRGCDATGFVQHEDGIDIEWTSPSDRGRMRAAYLVGCDGGRSTIRKRAGFAFPGTAPTLTMYTAVATIDHPERLLPAGWNRTAGGVFSYGAFADRLFLLDFSGPPADRDAPVTRDEIEGVLRRVSGADVRLRALDSGSRWTDHTRLVDTYRCGRVLLAGDAAHIHSPFGGQGMSLGLVDAANLGWKLAAVVRGDASERLLDSYTAERRPVAEAVLANTLAQVAIMRPDPQAGAMRDLVAKLLELDDVNRLFGEMMSGLATRYDLGSDRDAVGRLLGDRPLGRGDAVGTLYEALRDGTGVLLDASTGDAAARIVAATTRNVRRVLVDHGPSMLVRPDACVAWVAEGNAIDGLEDALRRWFAPARASQGKSDEALSLSVA